jgi:hypothetical protein
MMMMMIQTEDAVGFSGSQTELQQDHEPLLKEEATACTNNARLPDPARMPWKLPWCMHLTTSESCFPLCTFVQACKL